MPAACLAQAVQGRQVGVEPWHDLVKLVAIMHTYATATVCCVQRLSHHKVMTDILAQGQRFYNMSEYLAMCGSQNPMGVVRFKLCHWQYPTSCAILILVELPA